MATFGLTPGSSQIDIIGGLNYALSNIAAIPGNVLVANTTTGQVNIPTTGATYSYIYRYLFIAYAKSADGTTDFTIGNPANATYYGVRNSNNTAPSYNPAAYVWYNVPGGFGTTKFLFYSVIGGGSINFDITTGIPSVNWQQDNGNPIDLTIATNILNTTATNGDVLIYSGITPQWAHPSTITAGNATNASNVNVGDVTAPHTYYPSMTISRDGSFTPIVSDNNLIYKTFSSGHNNVLIADNLQANYVLTATTINTLAMITAPSAIITNVTATNISTGYISSPSAVITNLTSTNVVAATGQVSGRFTATYIDSNYASIDSVLTNNLTATNIIAATGQISGKFTATTINCGYVSGTGGVITNITSTNIVAATGQISGRFTATYINSSFVSADSAIITNFTATDIVSSTGQVSGTFTATTIIATEADISSVINLSPRGSAPSAFDVGTIAVANNTSWDPASVPGNAPYVTFYNGTAWVKLG